MPGFPPGPTRPNARAALPLTTRVLVSAVRGSLAVAGAGAAGARVAGTKGMVPAATRPDARARRRVRGLGNSPTCCLPNFGAGSQAIWLPIQFDACPRLARFAHSCGEVARPGAILIAWRMIPKKLAPHLMRGGYRFPEKKIMHHE